MLGVRASVTASKTLKMKSAARNFILPFAQMLRMPTARDLLSADSDDLVVARSLPLRSYACHSAIRDLYVAELCVRNNGFNCWQHDHRPYFMSTCKRKLVLRPCALPESPDVLSSLGYFVKVDNSYPTHIVVRWGEDAFKKRVSLKTEQKVIGDFTFEERIAHFFKAYEVYRKHLNDYNCDINYSDVQACGKWKMGF